MAQSIKSIFKPWVPPALLNWVRPAGVTSDISFDLPIESLSQIVNVLDSARVQFPSSQIHRTKEMVLPLGDLLSLATICATRKPKRIFEIGTYTGSSTLLMAMNTPSETDIFTLDLDPADMPAFLIDEAGKPKYDAGCLYRGTPEAARIHQLFGRSEKFDFTPYYGTIDLVYIDADHSYESVLRDSEIGMKLLTPGGLIIWDDYRWLPEHAECAGVTRALHELVLKYPIKQLAETRLAVMDSGSKR